MASCGASTRSASRPAAERGLARLGQPVGGPPVRRGDHRDVLERRGEGGPVARPLGREQVRDDGARHQLVADPEPLVGLRAHEAVLQRLGQPGGEVALEAACAATGQRRRPRRQPARQLGLDLGGRPGEAGAVHRPLRRCEQPQHAAAFGRPAGEAGRDEVGERARERRALELAARRDQLLDHQRRPRRSLRHEDDDRGGRTLPVDSLDQPGDLATREGREVHPDRRPEARLDDGEVLAQRMLPGQPVGLVGQDERDPLVARDAGHERRERAGRRVGGVQVLEHEDDRPLGGDPAQPAEQGLEGARLAALGVGEVAGARAGHALGTLGHAREAEQDRAGVAGQQRIDLLARALGQQGPQRIEHGRPGRVDGSVGLPAEDERRLGAADDPVERLIDEAGHAHPGAAPDDDRGRLARRGRRDGVDDPCELRLPADEPATDHATRHGRHCRVALGPPAAGPAWRVRSSHRRAQRADDGV